MRTRLKLLHMFTGILVAGLLGIHMVRLHLNSILGFFGIDAANPTSWGSMIGRATQGVWAGIYVVLLAVVLYHALYGLRDIVLEAASSLRAGRIITWLLIVVGILAFVWGSYVPLALLSR